MTEQPDDSIVDKAKGAIKSLADVARAVVSPQVSDEEHDKRKAICEGCVDADRKGERLFREIRPGELSCGEPMFDYEGRTTKIFRNEKLDGCGCWLHLKWRKEGAVCPRGHW